LTTIHLNGVLGIIRSYSSQNLKSLPHKVEGNCGTLGCGLVLVEVNVNLVSSFTDTNTYNSRVYEVRERGTFTGGGPSI
jgi:hypothetical protein